jgi:hypothetical protein
MTSKNKASVSKTDPPKKPMSSYFIYCQEHRDELKKRRPDIKFGELQKALAEDYKSLSEKERKVYEEKAHQLKVSYEKEMEEYKKKHGALEKEKKKKGDDDENSARKKPKKSNEKGKVADSKKAEEKKEEPKGKDNKKKVENTKKK